LLNRSHFHPLGWAAGPWTTPVGMTNFLRCEKIAARSGAFARGVSETISEHGNQVTIRLVWPDSTYTLSGQDDLELNCDCELKLPGQ
jgi:hypothetical protein